MIDLNSKIYVAGHNGLVGSAIVRKLKESSYYSDLRIRDVRDLRLLLDIYSSDASDVLFGENMFNFKNYKK